MHSSICSTLCGLRFGYADVTYAHLPSTLIEYCCLSACSFTTYSGYCTFADKSLGRNGIKFGMLMCPGDLPAADINTDGYCCHFMHSSIFSWDQAALWIVLAGRPAVCLSIRPSHLFTPRPSGLEGYYHHGPGGRAGGCQICGTHISVTPWQNFSIRSSVELSRPVVVHSHHGNLPICPIWACPWAKNLSNLAQIGSRLCKMQISETAGWIYPI